MNKNATQYFFCKSICHYLNDDQAGYKFSKRIKFSLFLESIEKTPRFSEKKRILFTKKNIHK
jgi:hypothetical protein